MPPKSHSRVHCSYCPPCTHPKGPSECLKDPVWNKKCKGNKRKDDLKTHNEAVHDGKAPDYVGKVQSSPLSSFLLKQSPPKKKCKLSEKVEEDLGNITEQVLEERDVDDVFFVENEAVELITAKGNQNPLVRLFKEGIDQISRKIDKLLLNEQPPNQPSISNSLYVYDNPSFADHIDNLHQKDSSLPGASKLPSNSQTESQKTSSINSIGELISSFPCFYFDSDCSTFKCTVCADYAKSIHSTKSIFSHKYDLSIGTDFTEANTTQPREFRNTKSSLYRHTSTKLHSEAVEWNMKVETEKSSLQSASKLAGMSLGRLVYADIKRGRPLSDYTENVMIASKNGSKVGDINHSKKFPPMFRQNCADVLTCKLKNKLNSPMVCTGRTPPVVVSLDKMTEKRRTGQITALASLIPEAPPSEMVQTYFIGNPVVREHNGKGLAISAANEYRKVIYSENAPEQIVGGGMDGQYFHLKFEEAFDEEMGLKKTFYYHDPAHRTMLAEGDARKSQEGTFVNKIISTISNVIGDCRFGKKYENLLIAAEKCPEAKFYKLDTFSETRFAAYSQHVFSAFLCDINAIISSLEARAFEPVSKQATDARTLLRSIANVTFIGHLAGVTDIYSVIGETCSKLQCTNMFLWERIDESKKCIQNLKRMITSDQIDLALWPHLKKYWPKLEINELIPGIPYLEDTNVDAYKTRRSTAESFVQPDALQNISKNLKKFISKLVQCLENRLLSSKKEDLLAKNISILTNLKALKSVKLDQGPDVFALRCMETFDFVAALKCTTFFDQTVTDKTLKEQSLLFLKRLHPFMVEDDQINSRKIFKNFMCREELYHAIPDFMQGVVTCFLHGHNESYVESIGSILKHHFPSNRNISLKSLEDGVIIHWNGPSLANCDEVVSDTITRMYGSSQWHFIRTCHQGSLKFHKVSQAVDNLQRNSELFYL